MSMQTVLLGEVAEFLNGGTPSKSCSDFFNGDIPWITGADITSSIVKTARSYITDQAVRKSATNVVPAGTVLLVTRTSVGKVAITGVPLAFSQDITAIVHDPGRVDSKYLAHFLTTQQVHFERVARGATIKGITRSVVESVRLPLPPLDEQRRIVAILDQAEELRAKRRAAIALLDQLPQAIFLEMFGDPASNPKGWQTKPLKAVTTKIGSGSTPTGGESAYKSEGIALIRSMNIHDGHFVPKGLAYVDEEQAAKLANVVVAPNDVLLNITGASVARVALVPKGVLPARVNQHVSILRCAQELSPRFLESLLINPSTKKSLLRVAGAGATREAITKEQLESFEILLPPTEAQELFAGRVEAISCVKSTHQAALVELDALFASLQAASFSGSTSS